MAEYRAELTIPYERDADEPDPFVSVAREFDGDLKDQHAYWGVRVTNLETGESRFIDLEELT